MNLFEGIEIEQVDIKLAKFPKKINLETFTDILK